MIISTEEGGDGDLSPVQLRPTLVPVSSIFYFASHGDSELNTEGRPISEGSKQLNVRFPPPVVAPGEPRVLSPVLALGHRSLNGIDEH